MENSQSYDNHNHALCQKMKAENECFQESCRSRFTKIIKSWKLDSTASVILDYTILIIELLIGEQKIQNGANLQYCSEILALNEFHKHQFFKASYFIECLEKSKLSLAHLHRISIFLQTKIFEHLSIKEYFEEMTSVASLYECYECKIYAPIDASLDDIAVKFYTSVRNRCKECFKKDASYRYNRKVESMKNSTAMISKIYLCMKCGENNFINFYERNKSKCNSW